MDAGVVELELLGAQAERVTAERGAAAGADPGYERQRPAAVGEQFGAVAEQRDRASPAELSKAGGEHPGDRPERIFVSAHRARGVDHEGDVRLLQRRGDDLGDLPRVAAHRHAECALGLGAHVRAGVESPARGALVDALQRPPLGLGEAVGRTGGPSASRRPSAGGSRHARAAVRSGRPVPRPVRPLGSAPAADLSSSWRSMSSLSCSSCPSRWSDSAWASASPSDGARLAGGSLTGPGCAICRAAPSGRLVRRRSLVRLSALAALAGRRRWGRADDLPVLAGEVIECVVVAVFGPDQPGEQIVQAGDVAGAECSLPHGR